MQSHVVLESAKLRPLRAMLPTVAFILTVGCSGESSLGPTAVNDGPMTELSTMHGSLVVDQNGQSVDFGALDAAIESGYQKARAQIGPVADQLRVDGYRIVIMPPSWDLSGEHVRSRREFRVRAGVERVLTHELQHFLAWELGRFSDCRTLQDHASGYDLNCHRLGA